MTESTSDELEITPENFGDCLVASARQAVVIARRDAPELRKRLPEQTLIVTLPPSSRSV